MRIASTFLVAIGALLIVNFGFNFDTTVPVDSGIYGGVQRVHNIGLMNRQMIGVICGVGLLLAGVIVFATYYISGQAAKDEASKKRIELEHMKELKRKQIEWERTMPQRQAARRERWEREKPIYRWVLMPITTIALSLVFGAIVSLFANKPFGIKPALIFGLVGTFVGLITATIWHVLDQPSPNEISGDDEE